MTAYSMDLRVRVLADCDRGMETSEVAMKYSVSPAWVRRVKQRRRETGEVKPRSCRNQVQPVLAVHMDALDAMVEQEPDASLEELCERVAIECGVSVSPATMWRALQALKLTVKKKRNTPRNRIVPT